MNQIRENLIIAIDGYSSCGKSTIAKDLSKKIGYTYIDSGAMYRAVTLFALRNHVINNGVVNEEKLAKLIDQISVSFSYNNEHQCFETYLNGEMVEDKIRSIEVSNSVSLVARIRFVRERMVAFQREISRKGAVVMDGRDIGTVVFPNADLKVFMTADPEIRAMRRFKELVAKNCKITLKEVRENIEERDYIDENRNESPLRKADDAIVLDNSYMTPTEQLDWIVERIEQL